jgi:ParB-like chromosome segregation protein Spo0J
MPGLAISREVALDQLVAPEHDVRDGRDPEEVRSIAASMGDPATGQQQPIATYPVDYQDRDLDDEDELTAVFEDGVDLVIHDGVTRYQAAQQLGWSTLWAVIVPEPPEDEVIARLEANTERIDMDDYEVFAALKEWYDDEPEVTLDDVGEKLGVSNSYVSRCFSLFDGPGFVRDAWEHSEHPLGTSHALAVLSMLSENTVDRYRQAGDLDEDEAYERAVEDARLMVDVQAEHDLQVSDFRQRCQRCQKETWDQLQSSSSLDEKQAEGATRQAERADSGPEPEAPPECTCCGGDRPNRRKYALQVCHQCYGMLSSAEANDEQLMSNDPTLGDSQDSPEDAVEAPTDVHRQAYEVLRDLPHEEVEAIVAELQRAAQSPQQAQHD